MTECKATGGTHRTDYLEETRAGLETRHSVCCRDCGEPVLPPPKSPTPAGLPKLPSPLVTLCLIAMMRVPDEG